MLEQFLVSQVFGFMIVFCRIGAGIMVLPGFGESYVTPRIRLILALAMSLVLLPAIGSHIPPFPASPLTLALLVANEMLIGIFLGTLCSIIISAMHVAGMVFSFTSGLSSAIVFDITANSQGSVTGNFLGIVAIVLVFTTDMHHLMLRGLSESYQVFTPGQFPPLHDFVGAVAHLLEDTFLIALQISAPLIVAGTILALGAGVLSRLMPSMQVFFIIIPVQVMLNFTIFLTTFSVMMLWFMEYYRDKLGSLMGYLR